MQRRLLRTVAGFGTERVSAGDGGGLTSIDDHQSVSFPDFLRAGFHGKTLPPNLLIAETFLVQDTRTKDVAGKDIVNISGGIKWSWQMKAVR
jgi:hypothetical protein